MPSDQKGASHHLGYEMQVFFGLQPSLTEVAHRQKQVLPQRPEDNALIESFVVHFRNLLDFFFPRNSKRLTDITFECFAWKPVSDLFAKDEGKLQYWRNRCDREVSHLTSYRLDVPPDDKPWDFSAIAEEMRRLFCEYETKIANIELTDKLFRDVLNKIRPSAQTDSTRDNGSRGYTGPTP
jgi:hypothetical protein